MMKTIQASFQFSSENGAGPTWISVGALGDAHRASAGVVVEHVDDVLDRLREVAQEEDVDPRQATGDQLPAGIRQCHLGPDDVAEDDRRQPDRGARRESG